MHSFLPATNRQERVYLCILGFLLVTGKEECTPHTTVAEKDTLSTTLARSITNNSRAASGEGHRPRLTILAGQINERAASGEGHHPRSMTLAR